jgi:preprotein translocase subunit YajC
MGVQKDKLELKIASNVKIDIAKTSIAVILTPQQKEK